MMYLGDQTEIIDAREHPADITANAWFRGPTPVDFSMLPTRLLVPRSEAKSLKKWRAQDLAQYYREIRRKDLS